MAYSIIGIVNMGLGRIGQPKIDSLSEDSVAAIQANVVWQYVRDEVLEAADWVFAKTRVVLSQNATTPVQRYDFAYTLPPDFLRVFRASETDQPVYPNGIVPSFPLSDTSSFFGSLALQGTKYNYVIEALADGTLCLFTNYDSVSEDLVLQYIRREENPARYTAHFASALSFRLGAELALVLTESNKKFENMMTLYAAALKSAKALNMSGDHVPDETGNTDWEFAGR